MPKSLQPVIFELKVSAEAHSMELPADIGGQFNAKKIRKRAKKADVQREEAEENVKKVRPQFSLSHLPQRLTLSLGTAKRPT